MDRLYKDMTPYEITLFYGLKRKKFGKLIENETVPQILYELLQAERKLGLTQTKLPAFDEQISQYARSTRI